LELKWSVSQKRKIANQEKPIFISFTAQTLHESNSLPHNSPINNSTKFLDSSLNPTHFYLFQNSKMSTISTSPPPSNHGDGSTLVTSAELSNTNSLASISSSMPTPIPIDSQNLDDVLSKYNLDISYLYTKYCLVPLETTKKRKASLDSTSNFVSESAPGFAIIRDIIKSTANFLLGLPLANDLLNATVRIEGRLPAIREAIDNNVILPRIKTRQNQDIINGMAHDIEALLNSVQEINAPYVNSYLVTLTFAIHQIGKQVKAAADWYRQQQDRLVRELELRGAQVGVRKSALEQQYQLLNDAHEDVGVRPSLW
jgi:hypothetical protein